MRKSITVLLAEDHAIVREGLRKLLVEDGGFIVVGEAENGRKAVELARRFRPAVVVMDIAMPLLNGMEATRQILTTHPATKVLILSAYSDDAYVEHVVAVGASGYLIKQTSFHCLARAIREVESGIRFFDPAIVARLETQKQDDRGRAARLPATRLSSRETEVLQLIAEGRMNKEIAAELKISIKTVEKHRQNVMDKLSIHHTAGLTRYAIGAGIIESSVKLTIV